MHVELQDSWPHKPYIRWQIPHTQFSQHVHLLILGSVAEILPR